MAPAWVPSVSQDAKVQEWVIGLLEEKFSGYGLDVCIPPPVFTSMGGNVVAYDPDKQTLQVKFPVRDDYLNPFGNMQGGMIAAVIDNTLGPLSMLAAPPNFTRSLEIKYRKPISGQCVFLEVYCRLERRSDRQLFFSALVRDEKGEEYARARAVHWILEGKKTGGEGAD